MSEQKIYVGGAKEVESQYGGFHKISFNRDDLELMMQNLNAKGYVNLNMNKRREPSQWGQTHSLVIDLWQPTQQAQQPSNPRQFQQPPMSQAQQDAMQNNPAPPPMFDDDNDDDGVPF